MVGRTHYIVAVSLLLGVMMVSSLHCSRNAPQQSQEQAKSAEQTQPKGILSTFARAKAKAQQTACLSNLKQIALALLMFDNDQGQLPEDDEWEQALMPYLGDLHKELLHCPSQPAETGYVFSSELAGKALKDMEHRDEVLLVWDAPLPDSPTQGPHQGEFNVAYADGHAATVTEVPSP